MALPFRVSWLCMLLWGCIYFAPQTGYNIAHGYHLYKSSKSTPGGSLNPNYKDETNAIMQQSFVSLKRELPSYKNRQHLSPVRTFSKDMVQSRPGLVHKADKFSSDNSKSQVWSRQDNHQMTNRHCSSNNPVDSTANLISSSVHNNHVFSQQSHLHPNNHLAAPELVSNDISDVSLSGGHNGIFSSASKNVKPNYKQTKSPSGLFLAKNSITGHKTDSVVSVSNKPFQNSINFSRKTSSPVPSNYKQKLQKSKYIHHRKDFSAGYPSGGSDNDDFHKVTRSGVLYQQKPPSFNYLVPRNKIHSPNYVVKKKKMAKSYTCQSSVGKKSNNGCYNLTNQMSVSAGTVSNLKNLSPLRGDHVDFRANVLHKPQQEVDRSNLVYNVKPSSSTKPPNYLGHQKVDVNPLYNQNLASVLQKPNGNAKTKYRGMDSTQEGVSRQKAKDHLNSISAQDRFLFLNGGYEDALKAGLLKTFNQPDVLQMFSAMKNEPTNFAFWPSEMVSEPIGLDSNCVIWKNTLHSSPPKSQKSTRSSVNKYIKFKNRSAKATAFLSKTCYMPLQQPRGF